MTLTAEQRAELRAIAADREREVGGIPGYVTFTGGTFTALLDAADRADAMVPLLVEALAYLAEHASTEPRREGVAKLCDRIAAALAQG